MKKYKLYRVDNLEHIVKEVYYSTNDNNSNLFYHNDAGELIQLDCGYYPDIDAVLAYVNSNSITHVVEKVDAMKLADYRFYLIHEGEGESGQWSMTTSVSRAQLRRTLGLKRQRGDRWAKGYTIEGRNADGEYILQSIDGGAMRTLDKEFVRELAENAGLQLAWVNTDAGIRSNNNDRTL